jgi:hypothetical protein
MSFNNLNAGCPCDCGECSDTICIFAWFRPDPAGPRTPIEDAEVTIERVYTDPITHLDTFEDYTTCTTDATGMCCVPTPDPFPNPTTAPTVDPDGGGATGGGLPVGTWKCAISSLTNYGETLIGPYSAEFQVGIPDADAYPTLAAPAVGSPTLGGGGALQVNTYVARHLFKDGAGLHNKPSASSVTFTVATLGDVPHLTLPALSLRDNATAVDLYLAVYDPDDEDGGTFRLYRSGITTTGVDLDTAFSGAAALAPSTNTSAKAIARVTYTPGTGSVSERVWAVNHDASARLTKVATGSPQDLVAPMVSLPLPTANGTGYGRFRITCDPPLCSEQVQTVTVTAECVNVGFDFGGKTIHFAMAADCCPPQGAEVEVFDGITSLGVVPLDVVGGGTFDASDLLPGTVLDWTFTDPIYPDLSGTATVPECGAAATVTIPRHLPDAYASLSLISPTGATVPLYSTSGGPFIGSETVRCS